MPHLSPFPCQADTEIAESPVIRAQRMSRRMRENDKAIDILYFSREKHLLAKPSSQVHFMFVVAIDTVQHDDRRLVSFVGIAVSMNCLEMGDG